MPKIHLYSAYGVTQCGRKVPQGRVTLLSPMEALPEEIPNLCKPCLWKVGKE